MSAENPIPPRVGLFDTSRSWESFGLDRRLFKALARLEFVFPTHAQALCLPPALEGKDVLVKAMTGSGKTLGYCLPALQTVLTELSKHQQLSPPPAGVITVILVCSKELVEQVRRTIQVGLPSALLSPWWFSNST